jgi:NitT/TauT family transport system substrate-binding protein
VKHLRSPLPAVLLALTALTACATTDTASTAAAPVSRGHHQPGAELRLGYFANVTHASAVYGVGAGTFAEELGAPR